MYSPRANTATKHEVTHLRATTAVLQHTRRKKKRRGCCHKRHPETRILRKQSTVALTRNDPAVNPYLSLPAKTVKVLGRLFLLSHDRRKNKAHDRARHAAKQNPNGQTPFFPTCCRRPSQPNNQTRIYMSYGTDLCTKKQIDPTKRKEETGITEQRTPLTVLFSLKSTRQSRKRKKLERGANAKDHV